MIGKSGNAFQLGYLKSIYIAVISSCNIRFSNLLLCKTDIEIEIYFLDSNLGYKKLANPVYQIVWGLC